MRRPLGQALQAKRRKIIRASGRSPCARLSTAPGPSGGMVDAGDSKSPAFGRESSNLSLGTNDLANFEAGRIRGGYTCGLYLPVPFPFRSASLSPFLRGFGQGAHAGPFA